MTRWYVRGVYSSNNVIKLIILLLLTDVRVVMTGLCVAGVRPTSDDDEITDGGGEVRDEGRGPWKGPHHPTTLVVVLGGRAAIVKY